MAPAGTGEKPKRRNRRAKPSARARAGSLLCLSVLVGVFAGLGAAAFRSLIAGVHNFLFQGDFSLAQDAAVHAAASAWGPLVVLVPVVGAIGVSFLTERFGPRAKGPGVADVIEAIYYRHGRIRPSTALGKMLASGLSIGSGASVGREGPIIQIGAALGSAAGRLAHLRATQCRVLVAAGAAGGIAATFNAPIGGILFAIEIVMRRVRAGSLIPVAVSAVTATYVARLLLGPHLFLAIPALGGVAGPSLRPGVLAAYAGLGLLMGLVSAAMIRSVYGTKDFFERTMPGRPYLRHGLGMLLVGTMMVVLTAFFGHYYVEGVGYATIHDVLSGTLKVIPLMLLLAAAKLIATSVSLGSGASGGVFSPALYVGATLGAAYAQVIHRALPDAGLVPAAFAIAGMAAMVGGTTGAALTTVVMVFEMTRDYNVILPVTLAVVLSFYARRSLCKWSIYTLKLARRGRRSPSPPPIGTLFARQSADLMVRNFAIVPGSMTLGDTLENNTDRSGDFCFLVANGDQIEGIVQHAYALRAMHFHGPEVTLAAVARRDFLTVTESSTLQRWIAAWRRSKARVVVVAGRDGRATAENVRGTITHRQIAEALADAVAAGRKA